VSRDARALLAAVSLHALAATLLWRVRVTVPRMTRPALVELEIAKLEIAKLEIAKSEPAALPTSPPQAVPVPPNARATNIQDVRNVFVKRIKSPILGKIEPETPQTNSAPPSPLSMRAPSLFPRDVIEGLATSPRATDETRSPSRWSVLSPEHQETPQQWADEANLAAQARAGRIAPVFRDIERALVVGFKPPPSVVHDEPPTRARRFGDKLGTYVKQMFAVIRRGEDAVRTPNVPGSRALALTSSGSIDPAQQGGPGMPAGLNYRSMPQDQQQAILAATGDPVTMIDVVIEVVVDGAGRVTRARVVSPSGRRAFDRYALAAVEAEVARRAPPPSRSRWRCRAGYAVAQINSVGIGVDPMMLFDKRARRDFDVQYPLKERVEARVSLEWVQPL
jgi:TonB family protein